MPHSSSLARAHDEHCHHTDEADRLAVDVALAELTLTAAPDARSAWGLDGRLLLADLRTQQRRAAAPEMHRSGRGR